MNMDYYINIFTCTFSSRSVGSLSNGINLAVFTQWEEDGLGGPVGLVDKVLCSRQAASSLVVGGPRDPLEHKQGRKLLYFMLYRKDLHCKISVRPE